MSSSPVGPNIPFLILLSIGHAVTDIFQGALPGLLPFFKDDFRLSYTMVGTLLAVSNLTSSVVQPAFGFFSDVASKRWLLPLGVFLAGAGIALAGLIHSYAILLLAVALSGLGIASYHPEASRISHHLAGNRRATGMAIYSVGGNLGYSLGPVLATATVGYLGLVGTGFLVLPAALMALIFLFLLPALSREERTAADHKGAVSRESLPPVNWRGEILLMGVVMIRSLIQFGILTFMPFYYVNYLGGTTAGAGRLLFVFLVSGVVGTLIGGPLADRIGKKTLLVASMTLLIPLQFLLLRVTGAGTPIVLALAGGTVVATFVVTLVMSQEFMPRYVGVASGLNIGLGIGMGGIGATAMGALADRWGIPLVLESLVILPLVGLLLAVMLPPTTQPETWRTRSQEQGAD